MRKIFFIIILSMFLFLTGCDLLGGGLPIVTGIEVVESSVPDEIVIGEFNINDVVIEVKLSDGTYKKVNCTDEMITEEARNLLNSIGIHTVEIQYEGVKCSFTIKVIEPVITYRVIFAGFDGSILKEETVVKGGSVTAPTAPSISGYKFIGWDKPFDNITTDILVTAVYEKIEVKTYTVKFFGFNNELLKEEVVEDGKSATAPVVSGLEGYQFDGWSVDFNNVTSDLEVFANFSIIKFTISFVVDGITLKEYFVEYNKSLDELPIVPEKEGFIGSWEFTVIENVKSDLIVNAIYQEVINQDLKEHQEKAYSTIKEFYDISKVDNRAELLDAAYQEIEKVTDVSQIDEIIARYKELFEETLEETKERIKQILDDLYNNSEVLNKDLYYQEAKKMIQEAQTIVELEEIIEECRRIFNGEIDVELENKKNEGLSHLLLMYENSQIENKDEIYLKGIEDIKKATSEEEIISILYNYQEVFFPFSLDEYRENIKEDLLFLYENSFNFEKDTHYNNAIREINEATTKEDIDTIFIKYSNLLSDLSEYRKQILKDLEEAYLPYKDIEQITNEYNIAVEEINNQEFGLAILNIYDSFIGSINNYLENELSLLKEEIISEVIPLLEASTLENTYVYIDSFHHFMEFVKTKEEALKFKEIYKSFATNSITSVSRNVSEVILEAEKELSEVQSSVSGIVIATSTYGYYLKDDTGILYVFTNGSDIPSIGTKCIAQGLVHKVDGNPRIYQLSYTYNEEIEFTKEYDETTVSKLVNEYEENKLITKLVRFDAYVYYYSPNGTLYLVDTKTGDKVTLSYDTLYSNDIIQLDGLVLNIEGLAIATDNGVEISLISYQGIESSFDYQIIALPDYYSKYEIEITTNNQTVNYKDYLMEVNNLYGIYLYGKYEGLDIKVKDLLDNVILEKSLVSNENNIHLFKEVDGVLEYRLYQNEFGLNALSKQFNVTIYNNEPFGYQYEPSLLFFDELNDLAWPGFIFEGFYLDPTFETKYQKGLIKEDITLYAKWVVEENDTNVYITYHFGDEIQKVEFPINFYLNFENTLHDGFEERHGYILKGIYMDEAFQEQFYGLELTKDIDIYVNSISCEEFDIAAVNKMLEGYDYNFVSVKGTVSNVLLNLLGNPYAFVLTDESGSVYCNYAGNLNKYDLKVGDEIIVSGYNARNLGYDGFYQLLFILATDYEIVTQGNGEYQFGELSEFVRFDEFGNIIEDANNNYYKFSGFITDNGNSFCDNSSNWFNILDAYYLDATGAYSRYFEGYYDVEAEFVAFVGTNDIYGMYRMIIVPDTVVRKDLEMKTAYIVNKLDKEILFNYKDSNGHIFKGSLQLVDEAEKLYSFEYPKGAYDFTFYDVDETFTASIDIDYYPQDKFEIYQNDEFVYINAIGFFDKEKCLEFALDCVFDNIPGNLYYHYNKYFTPNGEYGTTITYKSSNPSVIGDDGTFYGSLEDTYVVIDIEVSLDGIDTTLTRQLEIFVYGRREEEVGLFSIENIIMYGTSDQTVKTSGNVWKLYDNTLMITDYLCIPIINDNNVTLPENLSLNDTVTVTGTLVNYTNTMKILLESIEITNDDTYSYEDNYETYEEITFDELYEYGYVTDAIGKHYLTKGILIKDDERYYVASKDNLENRLELNVNKISADELLQGLDKECSFYTYPIDFTGDRWILVVSKMTYNSDSTDVNFGELN